MVWQSWDDLRALDLARWICEDQVKDIVFPGTVSDQLSEGKCLD